MNMGDFVVRQDDEMMHKPDALVNFNESVYTNGFSTAAPVGGWMRLGNRLNEGYAELSVCLYLPDGRVACQFQRPNISNNERFEAGGLSYAVIEPLKKVSMTFDGELMIVNDPDALRDPKRLFASGPRLPGRVHWTLEATSPVHGGEPANDTVQTMYGRDFSRGHFNQHARVHGEIRVGNDAFPIDGHGWRDHSWGPRYWQAIYWYRLFVANFPNGDGLMLLKITDDSGKSRRVGVLLVDGQYEDIVDMDLATQWSEQKDPQRVEIGVRTKKRKAVITGEIITLVPLRNRRKANGQTLESRIAEGFTRFAWNGQQGYGMTEYIERIENGRLAGYPL
jgi:hypothetical protein